MYALDQVPFSDSSSWNTPIGSSATYTNINWPAATPGAYWVNWDEYSPSVYIASESDPLVTVSYPSNWGQPAGSVTIHMPAAADGASGTDGELLIVDGNNVYNFWQFERTGTNTARVEAIGSTDVETGTGWGTLNPKLNAGTVAAGASELAGLLVEAETNDGSIDHALQIAVDWRYVQPGFTGSAIQGDGSNSGGLVQEGQRLAIPPGTPMPSGLSELGQQVFVALQTYGAYVIDVAGATTLRAQANGYDQATINALQGEVGKLLPLLDAVSGGTVTTPAANPTNPSTPTNPTVPVSNPTTPTTPTNPATPPVASPTTPTTPSDPTTTPVTNPTTPTTPSDPTTSGGWDGRRHYHRSRGDFSSGDQSFGTQSTLGYAADSNTPSAASGSTSESALSLLRQYTAASFAQSTEGWGGNISRHFTGSVHHMIAPPRA